MLPRLDHTTIATTMILRLIPPRFMQLINKDGKGVRYLILSMELQIWKTGLLVCCNSNWSSFFELDWLYKLGLRSVERVAQNITGNPNLTGRGANTRRVQNEREIRYIYLDGIGPEWILLDWTGLPNQTGLHQTRPARAGLDWIGLDRITLTQVDWCEQTNIYHKLTRLWVAAIFGYIFTAYFCQLLYAEYHNFSVRRLQYLVQVIINACNNSSYNSLNEEWLSICLAVNKYPK